MKRQPIEARSSSRQAILDRIQANPVEPPPLPVIDSSKLTRFDDPLSAFCEMLTFVGGEAHVIETASEVSEILAKIDVYQSARRIASVAPEYIQGNLDTALIEDPHELESLDWVIARGEFAVAENGAIWIDGNTLPHRVMLFIAQYMAIVVPKEHVVHNMHEAYDRIGDPRGGFGVFVSGPSKTADIEQSLVLGAQGCRKLQVFLV